MKLRPPSIPLITCDPYFSVWSSADHLTDTDTVHWTNSPISLRGTLTVDGKAYRFMGADDTLPAAEQVSFDMTAFSTIYVFAVEGYELTAKFTSPIIPTDLYLISRPVSYLELSGRATDKRAHRVSVKVSVSEEICLDKAGQNAVIPELVDDFKGLSTIKMGSGVQEILAKDGDDLRIDWGYFYLSAAGAAVGTENKSGKTYVYAECELRDRALFTFAYDDIKSIEYFHDQLKAYWKRNGETIRRAVEKAHRDYDKLIKKCDAFSAKMIREATACGGEKYADLLVLSLRQCIAAHKLVVDNDGELLFISKECYSNGCAATVDVSYPSIPLFLIYNPKLVHAMMRPIYRYAVTEEWPYDFAPHDAGRYPILNGQMYHGTEFDYQMPLEECGNMLVMEATAAVAGKDASFAASHIEILEKWAAYLIENGADPANQLCTDDFAGHLAHNCNLTLKAIMGIAGFGLIKRMLGDEAAAERYITIAREMGADWKLRAANGDGSYRLAYNWQKSFSMKYNMVWDKLFGTEIMPRDVMVTEFASYKKHMHDYGMPLDNRADYTKSDWYIWCGVMAPNKVAFEKYITPLWDAYNETESRVPMTDWYFTSTALHRDYGKTLRKSFRNRTVVGGHFMKLLEYKKILKQK